MMNKQAPTGLPTGPFEQPARVRLPKTGDTRLRSSFWMFVTLIGAMFLRLYHLDIKPVHFDEGINGHFVNTIWREGFYRYDPTNFHGPLYFYILALAEKVFGFGIFGFRFATALIQFAVILVVGFHRRFLGRVAIWAAVIIALSPGFVFYSRYAIHESLFILGQVAFSYGYFSYRAEKSQRSIWWMDLALVILISTKETFFIFIGTWAIAVACDKLFDRYFPRFANEPEERLSAPEASIWVSIALVSLILITALFTGFFLYMHGVLDFFTALAVWTKTGQGHSGHEKPLLYYIDLLRKYEGPALIGLIASPVLCFFANRQLRILLLVGVGTFFAYSLIPYKTPWLILNLLWPLSIAAGAVISRTMPALKIWRGVRSGLAIATVGTLLFSGREMWRLNFKDFASKDEPYVYVQSSLDFKRAVDTIFIHIAKYPEDQNMRLLSLNRDPWPLPWLLMRLPNAVWSKAVDTNFAAADVVLSDVEDKALIESRLTGTYYVMPFQIRDSYQDGQAYFAQDKFKGDVPIGTPEFTGPKPEAAP